MDGYEQARDCLNMSYVQRWVIAPMLRTQSVAEHTFRVMVLVRVLVASLIDQGYNSRYGNGTDMYHALLAAMDHDADEVYTGDMPGTDKDKHKEWADPDSLQSWEIVVKVADALETWDWWLRWGVSWNHPKAPGRGDQCRDIRKVKHYTKEWPQLFDAAKTVAVRSMGHSDFDVEATFGTQSR